MLELFKWMLRPIRFLASRFIIHPEVKDHSPIAMAANFVHSENIDGDYLEFGVFRGASFLHAYHALIKAKEDWESIERTYSAYSDRRRAEEAYTQVENIERRFFAFDSFDGLPEPEGIDRNSARFTEGRYDCSEEEFRNILLDNGVVLDKVITVPGYYEDSLSDGVKQTYDLEKAAIIMIDCDLYESTKLVLKFVTDLVVDGTVIIFDDWFNFKGNPDMGEQRACREWLEDNPHIGLTPYIRWSMTQFSFIVNLRES